MTDTKNRRGDRFGEPDDIEFSHERLEFVLAEDSTLPSSMSARDYLTEPIEHIHADRPSVEPTRSPAFRALAEPYLPQLGRGNRARLSMQTPTRLFFYWSTAAEPFRRLNRALRDQAANYALVLKLVDLKHGSEEIHRIEQEGEWWFQVEADGEYRAEIGFYSPSRPYVRIMKSNVVQTPRKNPSPHSADEAEWRISSERFASVLNVAGFKQDAFDVAIAGEDAAAGDALARRAFTALISSDDDAADHIPADELRHAMFALAAGATLESLKYRIGARLFALLQANAAKLNAAAALSTVQEHFDIEAGETVEEKSLSAVYGSTSVNFPRSLSLRTRRPGKFEPVSSYALGRRPGEV